MNKKQRKSAQKRRKVYRELDESMAKGRKFLKKETDKKGNLSQRAKNLQEAIKAARRRGTVSTMMGKGGGDIADKLKTLKDGGSVKKFPDLSGDGKVTQKDILMGRGVIERKRGGSASKDRKTKTEAYRKLGKQKYDKGMTPDIGEKGRKSFKKTRVKKKDLVDIAGVIKSTGDRYLGKLGNLKTRFKDKKTAKAAGVQFRAKGGLAGRLAKRGYGKARK